MEFFLKKGAEANWKATTHSCIDYENVPMMTALTTKKEGMEEMVDLLFRSGFKGDER